MSNGKGDKWRKTDFKKYWESDYWQLKEKNKEKKNGKSDTNSTTNRG